MCKRLLPERTILTVRQCSNPFEEYNLHNSVSALTHAVPSHKQFDFSSLHVSIENEHNQTFATELQKRR